MSTLIALWLPSLSLASDDPFAALLATSATTAADEYAIGKDYIDGQIWLQGKLEDTEQQARVEGIMRRVLAASDRPDQVYNVVLLDDEEVNAAALPGGFLMVNKGLLDLVDDNQLAFVLGHELSHVLLRHGASAMTLQTATAAALRSARGKNDRQAAAEQSQQLYLLLASHSRQLELEADLYGLLYAVRAGYPSEAAITALGALETSVGGDMTPEEVPWASHPLFADRIAELQLGVTSIQRTRAQFDAGFQWLRAGQYEQAITTFQQFLTLFPHSQAGWSNLGAAHLYQAREGSEDPWLDVLPLHSDAGITVRGEGALARDRARDALGHALRLDPTDPVALGLFGVLARMEGRLPEARQLFERALLTATDAAPLLVDLGNVAAQEGDTEGALAYWAQASALAPDLVEPLVNQARLYESQGKKKKKQAIEAWRVVLAAPGWSQIASEHLAALGVKGIDAPAPATTGPEKLTGGSGPLAVGDSFDDLVSRLGPPDFDIPADDQGVFHFVAWDAGGVSAAIRSGRVVTWAMVEPGDAQTSAGIGIGSTVAEVVEAYGEPTTEFQVGAVHAMQWNARGLVVGLRNGVVAEVDLCVLE